MRLPYANRTEAGRALAARLTRYIGCADVLVLGLPRGGVPVAYEVAEALKAPLDMILVRKLGLPGHAELAMGAIATGDICVLNPEVVEGLDIPKTLIDKVVATELQELQRRERVYRGDRPTPRLAGRCVILIDDGLATGATMRAAIAAVRQQKPARLVVAVPVAPAATIAVLQQEADEVVCPATPEPFFGIGQWYKDFAQVSDAEVQALLRRQPPERVTVRSGEVALEGELTIPTAAEALVVFAHGSGSSRHSPRNQLVAETLYHAGLATLLFDLLTPAEEQVDMRTRALRFNIALLAERLTGTVDWAGTQVRTQGLRLGLFGASTGAAAALMTAAQRPGVVGAVVARGGRPDLARDALPRVKAPTLLIVGSEDTQVLALNRQASRSLQATHQLAIVPGATHLFEEPGTLEEVARLARDWFTQHLSRHY